MSTDSTSVCNECGQLRSIIKTGGEIDLAVINDNFALLNTRVDKICALLDSIIKDDHVDFKGKCLVNVGTCCTDPTSIATIDYINKTIKGVVAQLVVDMVTDPQKYLKGIDEVAVNGNMGLSVAD